MIPKSLSEIQNWIQSKILDDKVVTNEESDAVLNSTDRFSHQMRWKVYQGAIRQRQMESLFEDFPVTTKLVTEKNMREILAGYLKSYPSRYPSLLELGRNLSSYLRLNPSIDLPWLSDLTAFEFTLLTMKSCGYEPSTLAPEKLALLDLISLDKLVFSIDPTCTLLSVDYPVSQFFEDEVILPASPTQIIVYSRDNSAYYEIIDPTEYAVLKASKEGATLMKILELFSEFQYTGEKVFETFQSWMQKNWIQNILVIGEGEQS